MHASADLIDYSEYLKRDDQILVLRLQNEDSRNRMARSARDKDRALAHSAQDGPPAPDADIDMDEDLMQEDPSQITGGSEAVGANIIVIHPGSQNLRIGLASDALPKTSPMVIARRSSKSESEGDHVEPKPKRRRLGGEGLDELDKFVDEEVRYRNSIS